MGRTIPWWPRSPATSAILQAKGDLDGALTYTQRALKIDEKVYGPDNPTTQAVAANLDRIRHTKQP
jgi:hypothetical protein